MVHLKVLPLLEGATVIIVDEGSDAAYGNALITGWLQTWKEKSLNCTFELLSFLNPVSRYKDTSGLYDISNLRVHDFYTLDVDKKEGQNFDAKSILNDIDKRSITIVDCLTSLIFQIGRAKCISFIKKLSMHVSQLICIYRRDFIEDIIPQIQTLGTTYVRIEKFCGANSNKAFVYITHIVHRKSGGSILQKKEIVNQNMSYEIISQYSDPQIDYKPNSIPEKKVESSFRIDLNKYEMKQREEMILPYTISKHSGSAAKIMYEPDNKDDIDVDDPDDDLCF